MAVATPFSEKTDEQRAITEMVRQFVDEQVIPIAEEHDHEDKFPDAVVEQMRELGLFGVTIPEEYGGMGLGAVMTLTLVFDHRAVDGQPAALFLAALRDRLERAELADSHAQHG